MGRWLADMHLISAFNKGFRFLLCVIDIFSKYPWIVLWKNKKGASIVNSFQKVLKNMIEAKQSPKDAILINMGW